jgi:hypothetical protein
MAFGPGLVVEMCRLTYVPLRMSQVQVGELLCEAAG